jgi:protein-L-isoaspartate(D-aspartate) O-methyltransferase
MIRKMRDVYELDSPKVLSVMLRVPRERFVPEDSKHLAYSDLPVFIGYEQTMSQPYTVAAMTHLLLSDKKDLIGEDVKNWKVLEIGTGLGYQAAILSRMVKKVYTMEIIKGLAESAKEILKDLKYDNIEVVAKSGERGWPEKAPFDAIMITAQIDKIPREIFKQLKRGGTLIAPVGGRDTQVLTRFLKDEKGKIKKEEQERYVFVPFVREND